jgi:hypothetical protein
MSPASRPARFPTRADLSLPRWTFVAWLVHSRQLRASPRPGLAAKALDVDTARRARLLRELVPQDA